MIPAKDLVTHQVPRSRYCGKAERNASVSIAAWSGSDLADIDSDAHTLLGFAPVDPEPTCAAESLAWSGEQEEIEDYPFSPETAPTVILGGRTAPLAVLVVLLAAVVVILTVVAARTATQPAPEPPAPAPVTVTITPTTSVPPPPPPPPVLPPPPPPTTVTVAPSPPQPSANEHQFIQQAWELPSYIVPGSHAADAQATLTAGYQACAAMDQHPDNGDLATRAFYQGTLHYTLTDRDWYNADVFMIYAANNLCPRHSGMWENF